MKKVLPLSGFPEWLPDQRIVELQLLDQLRRQFESFGFASVDTRAIEPLRHLVAQGETEKEIYVLRRLHAEPGDDGAGKGDGPGGLDPDTLGLHFDLTVPFARYVLENQGQLDFPFKRYQIQKVWRGEKPQEGRYREFIQADIDVIGQQQLPLHFDAEMAVLLHQVVTALPVPPVRIHLNNRKVLEGLYRGLGIEGVAGVLRVVDKLDKIGEEAVGRLLLAEGLDEAAARTCLSAANLRGGLEVIAAVRALGVEHPMLDEGLTELEFVLQATAHLPSGAVIADLRIARGLDYYTGTVYEGYFVGRESFGAVCSGGRYDDLAGGGGAKLPGVGVSVGLTRMLGLLFKREMLRASRKTPTAVLVALPSDDARPRAYAVANVLRAAGVPTEVFHAPQKYGKQIRYAERKGIPFVWFPAEEQGGNDEVRDIRSGEQVVARADAWLPPTADLQPAVVAVREWPPE